MKKMFETERTVLRPWEPSDADAYYKLVSDTVVCDSAGSCTVKDVIESKKFIDEVLIPRGCNAIELKESCEVIGNIALLTTCYSNVFNAFSGREIAFSLSQPNWGKGLMKEILDCLLKYGFNDLKLDFISCAHFEDNERCRNLINNFSFCPAFSAPSNFTRSNGTEPIEIINILTKDRYLKAK